MSVTTEVTEGDKLARKLNMGRFGPVILRVGERNGHTLSHKVEHRRVRSHQAPPIDAPEFRDDLRIDLGRQKIEETKPGQRETQGQRQLAIRRLCGTR